MNHPSIPSYVITNALRLLLIIILNSNHGAKSFVLSGGSQSILQRIINRNLYKVQPNENNNALVNRHDPMIPPIVPKFQESTTTTLSCWVLAALLARFSTDFTDENLDSPLFSPRSRKVRISNASKTKRGQAASGTSTCVKEEEKESKSGKNQNAAAESVEGTTTRETVSNDGDLEGKNEEDRLRSTDTEETENETSIWKSLNIRSGDLCHLSESLCELILEELQQTGVPLWKSSSIPATFPKLKPYLRQRRSSLSFVASDLLLASTGLIAYIAGIVVDVKTKHKLWVWRTPEIPSQCSNEISIGFLGGRATSWFVMLGMKYEDIRYFISF